MFQNNVNNKVYLKLAIKNHLHLKSAVECAASKYSILHNVIYYGSKLNPL